MLEFFVVQCSGADLLFKMLMHASYQFTCTIDVSLSITFMSGYCFHGYVCYVSFFLLIFTLCGPNITFDHQNVSITSTQPYLLCRCLVVCQGINLVQACTLLTLSNLF